jgi:hypothetical protein
MGSPAMGILPERTTWMMRKRRMNSPVASVKVVYRRSTQEAADLPSPHPELTLSPLRVGHRRRPRIARAAWRPV